MLTAKVPEDTLANYQINMVWGGLFHAFTWIMDGRGRPRPPLDSGNTKDVPWSGRTCPGSLIAGWGIFSLVEGIIDHRSLHVHHGVESMGVSIWDYVFLGSGLLLVIIGGAVMGRSRSAVAPPRGGKVGEPANP